MKEIIELSQCPELLEDAVRYFWEQWGSDRNFFFYQDCIKHSMSPSIDLPSFYLMQNNGQIIGTYALLRNDLISRQDLCPWFACLYVDPVHRGCKIGGALLEHAKKQAFKKGYHRLYLATDLENYYEKYGWKYLFNGFGAGGGSIKIYGTNTND